MLNMQIEATVTSTTPFAFEDGDSMRHGLMLGLEVAQPRHHFLDDVSGNMSEKVAEILDGKLPIKNEVKIKFLQLNGLTIKIGEITRACEIAEISVAADVAGERAAHIKVKLRDVTPPVMGYLCMRLRMPISFMINTTQGELPLAPPADKKADKPTSAKKEKKAPKGKKK